jgi:CRP-like cAMP-binding protein
MGSGPGHWGPAQPAANGGSRRADQEADEAHDTGEAAEVPVIADNVRWERPTIRSFWNALADPERKALAAAGVEEFFRAGSVLCREGDESSQVMIIDSGWVKVSVAALPAGGEKILAVRAQGDIIGERAALTTRVRSATVTALDEVSAVVVPAERFVEFLLGHPRAAEVLERQVVERREEDKARLFRGEPASAERRLAWLLSDLIKRRGGYQQGPSAPFTLPMSQQELADWVGTSADAVAKFLRAWRERGVIVRDRSRRLTIVDLDGLDAIWAAAPAPAPAADPSAAAAGRPAAGPVPRNNRVPGVAGSRLPARWPDMAGEQLTCSVLYTDIAGFGDPERNDGDRRAVRMALYDILQSALETSGVPWAEAYHEDRGDGAIVVVPPGIPTMRVVDPLIPELASRLRQYNRRASDVVRIQLRAALHVGPVGMDDEGLTGPTVILAARIVDAQVLKERLADAQADLVFAVSSYVYDHFVRDCAGRVDAGSFEHVECQVKKSRVSAWIHLAGPPPDGSRPGWAVPVPQAAAAGEAARTQALAPEGWVGPLPVEAPLGKLPADVRGLRYRRDGRARQVDGGAGRGPDGEGPGLPRLVGERGRHRVADRRDAGGAAGTRRA